MLYAFLIAACNPGALPPASAPDTVTAIAATATETSALTAIETQVPTQAGQEQHLWKYESPSGEWYVEESTTFSGQYIHQTFTIRNSAHETSWVLFDGEQENGPGMMGRTIIGWDEQRQLLYYEVHSSGDGCGGSGYIDCLVLHNLLTHEEMNYKVRGSTLTISPNQEVVAHSGDSGVGFLHLVTEARSYITIEDLKAIVPLVGQHPLQLRELNTLGRLVWAPDSSGLVLLFRENICLDNEFAHLVYISYPELKIFPIVSPDHISLYPEQWDDEGLLVTALSGSLSYIFDIASGELSPVE